MTDRTTLPDGWQMVKFGDVVRKTSEKVDPEESGLERYIAGEHMDTDDLRLRRWGMIGEGYLGPAFHRGFRPGQVLYGSRRTYLRKVAVADFEGVTANTTFVLEPKGDHLLPELLPFVMSTESFHAHSIQQSKGSVNPYINWKDLAWYEFPLPSKNEQRRIAEVLWATVEASDCYVGVREALRSFRRSFLCQISGSNSLSSAPDQVEIGSLVRDGILKPPEDGNHGELHPTAKDYAASGVPFIMASDISEGQLDLANCKRIPLALADSLRKGFARPGDILLTHKGTVGEVAILPRLDTPYAMLTPQVTAYRVQRPEALDPMFLFYCFQAPAFQRQLERYSAQSTRAYIGITAQRTLRLPLPPLQDQKLVVAQMAKINQAIAKASDQIKAIGRIRSRTLVALLNR